MKLIKLNAIDSTNEYIKKIKSSVSDNLFCLYTFNQTNGKGQRGKNWISFKGNLFMSLFFQIEKKLSLKKITKLNTSIIKECLKKFSNYKIKFFF